MLAETSSESPATALVTPTTPLVPDADPSLIPPPPNDLLASSTPPKTSGLVNTTNPPAATLTLPPNHSLVDPNPPPAPPAHSGSSTLPSNMPVTSPPTTTSGQAQTSASLSAVKPSAVNPSSGNPGGPAKRIAIDTPPTQTLPNGLAPPNDPPIAPTMPSSPSTKALADLLSLDDNFQPSGRDLPSDDEELDGDSDDSDDDSDSEEEDGDEGEAGEDAKQKYVEEAETEDEDEWEKMEPIPENEDFSFLAFIPGRRQKHVKTDKTGEREKAREEKGRIAVVVEDVAVHEEKRREKEAKLVAKIAKRHNVKPAVVDKVLDVAPVWKKSRKVLLPNAKASWYMQRVNPVRIAQGRLAIGLIRAKQRIKANPELVAATPEHEEMMVKALEQKQALKATGPRGTAVGAAKDVASIHICSDYSLKLVNLSQRCNVGVLIVVVPTEHPSLIKPYALGVNGGLEFVHEHFGLLETQLAQPSVTTSTHRSLVVCRNGNLSLGQVTAKCAKFINDGLDKILNTEGTRMNYKSYINSIVQTRGVYLANVPEGVPWGSQTSLTSIIIAKKWLDALESGACCWKGEVKSSGPRKPREDIGRKHKTGEKRKWDKDEGSDKDDNEEDDEDEDEAEMVEETVTQRRTKRTTKSNANVEERPVKKAKKDLAVKVVKRRLVEEGKGEAVKYNPFGYLRFAKCMNYYNAPASHFTWAWYSALDEAIKYPETGDPANAAVFFVRDDDIDTRPVVKKGYTLILQTELDELRDQEAKRKTMVRSKIEARRAQKHGLGHLADLNKVNHQSAMFNMCKAAQEAKAARAAMDAVLKSPPLPDSGPSNADTSGASGPVGGPVASGSGSGPGAMDPDS
ncbi:hypothetical protein C8F01DRAFT_1343740 [Mycena amicta]|nr:hypothetical protein C8F01DRAFT_1343740 [Mycena amicta]